MEKRNRTIWIVVAVVVVLLCCAAAAVAALLAGGLVAFPIVRQVSGPSGPIQSLQIERSFELGNGQSVQIDNFAGAVTVRAGSGTTVQVLATVRGPSSADLSRIQVEMIPQDRGLLIQTRKPADLSLIFDNVSVQIEVTTPPGAPLAIQTGAGSIEVSGMQSMITVNTGAGSVDLMGITGPVHAATGAGSVTMTNVNGNVVSNTGAGSIDYAGTPSGQCRFESGAGSITLNIPANLGGSVDLGSGIGKVTINIPVSGEVTPRQVTGTIGGGGSTTIFAHTGTGSVDLIGR
jgi:hypothetical protein